MQGGLRAQLHEELELHLPSLWTDVRCTASKGRTFYIIQQCTRIKIHSITKGQAKALPGFGQQK
jgi:hypothetical protein